MSEQQGGGAVVLRGFNYEDERYGPGDEIPSGLPEKVRRKLIDRGALPDGETDFDGLLKLRRPDLDQRALAEGVEAPEELRTKEDVVAAIRDELAGEPREQLNERAREAGVPDPEGLPNKAAVLAALDATEGSDD